MILTRKFIVFLVLWMAFSILTLFSLLGKLEFIIYLFGLLPVLAMIRALAPAWQKNHQPSNDAKDKKDKAAIVIALIIFSLLLFFSLSSSAIKVFTCLIGC